MGLTRPAIVLSSVDFPIPGNDDALRAISLYCDLIAASVLKGLESNLEESGVDVGESEVLAEQEITGDAPIEENSHEEVNFEETTSIEKVINEDSSIKNDK